MIELIASDTEQASIGVAGDTYNTAVYLNKLSTADIEVSYITALGTDRFSDRIFSELVQHGIRSDKIEKRETHMPGLYAISTDELGERSFSYWRGEAAARTLFQEPCTIKPELLCDFDLIYVSGISMAILPPETRTKLISFLADFRNAGGKLVFDSNYRPRLWESVEIARDITMTMWSITDVALPSIDDEIELFGDQNEAAVLARLIEAGVSFGALKRGLAGPLPIGQSVTQKIYTKVADVVDTTAAGDSFNAGFLLEYAQGRSLEDAMQTGHTLAAKVIQAKGAIIDIDEAFMIGRG